MIYIYRGTIPRFNSPWNYWNCSINGTPEDMERKGKRTGRKWSPITETLRGLAFTTVGKPTIDQRLPSWKSMKMLILIQQSQTLYAYFN